MHSRCASQGARLSIFGLAAMVAARKRYEPSQAVLLQLAIILLWKTYFGQATAYSNALCNMDRSGFHFSFCIA